MYLHVLEQDVAKNAAKKKQKWVTVYTDFGYG